MEYLSWLYLFLFIILLLALYLGYRAHSERQHYASRGIFYLGYPLYTIVFNLVVRRMNILEVFTIQYRKMKEAGVSFGANKDQGKDSFMISDLNMLKSIFVKDFDHFVNRRKIAAPSSDLLIKKMLIFQEDEIWKALRSKLSPTFTTGKIKRMFALFKASSEKLVKYVDKEMEDSTDGEIDLWEGYSKFTMDTIASAVCGMDAKTFETKEPSTFEKMGKHLQVTLTPLIFIKFIIFTKFPKLASLLGLTLFGSREMYEFFSGAIKSTIKDRQEKGEKRDDFIQLMLEAREGKLKTDESELDSFEKDAHIKDAKTSASELLDDDGIVSNCVLFILAGFDTTQSLLLFCAYALAIYPDIQDKLREEVEAVLEENGGEFTYESLHKMVYLDQVINETLRFYPPATATDRSCTQDWEIPGTDIVMKKGSIVLVPVYTIQHDPDHYPDPEKFDPERFSPENKHKINPYAFLPFGQGPRNCIGMRFALTEVKLAIVQLVHNFSIEPSKKTLIPMKFQSSGSLKPDGGMWLALKKRG